MTAVSSADFDCVDLPTVERDCETHGQYSAMRRRVFGKDFEFGCPVCSEEKKAKRAEQEKAEAERKERERWERLLSDLGIGRRHMYKTFDNYDAQTSEKQSALEACKAFCKAVEDGAAIGGLVLLGKPGTGKTHLSCAAINSLARKQIYGERTNLRDMLAEIKATYNKGSESTEVDLIAHYGRRRLLVLDEVGAFAMSEHEKAIFTSIMDRRYENEGYTVLVSNLDFEALKAEIGDRNIDRLREDGGRVVKFTWESNRG